MVPEDKTKEISINAREMDEQCNCDRSSFSSQSYSARGVS